MIKWTSSSVDLAMFRSNSENIAFAVLHTNYISQLFISGRTPIDYQNQNNLF